MAASFFFYDLETSGLNPHKDRIMQFAGQRTDMDLKPIGEPINLLVTLTEDVLPEPGALLITGITPQKTRDEGYTEAQFLQIICDQVLTPDTIIIGYNNIRFDDEFMRCTFYRNMYDPYEWQSREGRSRWDLLDVVRLTRALRPDGIKWPTDEAGLPSNRLEHLSAANGLEHEHAHDAMSDVTALIAVAQLIQTKQPKLYDYLLKQRDKKAAASVVNQLDEPFIYTTYAYPKQFMHTSVVATIGDGKYSGTHLVFDLRQDPAKWLAMSANELRSHCQTNYEERGSGYERLPVQEIKCNGCPAVAPYLVLQADKDAQARLELDPAVIRQHAALLRADKAFGKRVQQALDKVYEADPDVDCQIYNGFPPETDKPKMADVRSRDAAGLRGFNPGFTDKRLQQMLIRYKARNFPGSLSDDERGEWETYRVERLKSALPHFAEELQKAAKLHTDADTQYLIEELQLYAQSIVPIDE